MTVVGPDLILLVLVATLGVVAVGTGMAVFTVDSMARASFLLLTSFVAVAVVLIALGLAYLGVVIVLMMVIEMMIMAVFMVMFMMNPAGLEPMRMVHARGRAWLIALGVFVVLAAGAVLVPWPVAPAAAAPGTTPDPTVALGDALMGPQMLTMMTLALVLLATVVGAVALSVSRGARR